MRAYRNFIQFLFLFSSLLLLSACQKYKTTDYYLLHPEEIQQDFDRCENITSVSVDEANNCQNLLKAIPIFKSYLSELKGNANSFGVRMMQSQMKLAELKKAYRSAKESHNALLMKALSESIKIYEQDIQRRYAILRLIADSQG